MPRRARVTVPDVAHHLIQRGNNRQACFVREKDYKLFLRWLHEYAIETGCALHAYVLMTNHFHLLSTPTTANGVGHLMKRLGQRYVQYFNRTYQRTGSLWEGRFRSCLVQSDLYALACYRYIELNPVRAAMVQHPGEYPWSSYRANAQGETTALLSPHETYESLGDSPEQRRASYRQLFAEGLCASLVAEFRSATNGNYALGNKRFQTEIARALGRRVWPGRSGRPTPDK